MRPFLAFSGFSFSASSLVLAVTPLFLPISGTGTWQACYLSPLRWHFISSPGMSQVYGAIKLSSPRCWIYSFFWAIIWVAPIRWVIQCGRLPAFLMKMLLCEREAATVFSCFGRRTWLLAQPAKAAKTVASTAKRQPRQLQTGRRLHRRVLNKNHDVCMCMSVCIKNQGSQMKIYVSCAYLCRNVCPGSCHNFSRPPFFFICRSVVLVSLSMRHFQWLPLFACVARKCGKAAGLPCTLA